MFKHYFERVEGIEFFPLLSLIMFVLFFLSLLIWVLMVNKRYIHDMSQLPLDNSQVPSSTANAD